MSHTLQLRSCSATIKPFAKKRASSSESVIFSGLQVFAVIPSEARDLCNFHAPAWGRGLGKKRHRSFARYAHSG